MPAAIVNVTERTLLLDAIEFSGLADRLNLGKENIMQAFERALQDMTATASGERANDPTLPGIMRFSQDDCVKPTVTLTQANADYVQGSAANPNIPPIVDITNIGAVDEYSVIRGTFRVNFGSRGIWHVRGVLLELHTRRGSRE